MEAQLGHWTGLKGRAQVRRRKKMRSGQRGLPGGLVCGVREQM